ncbi:MAG: FG-GAP-like repeat-containing protein, partial [Fimbriimonadales bacterium]|nr:FG-GAP-like repeat-containing protein [Fimbriimonadales bacterium]
RHNPYWAGDKLPEIFVGASGNGPYVCLNGQGKVLWEYNPRQGAPEVFDSSGAIADLDGDKRMEIVFGSTYFLLDDTSGALHGYLHVMNAADGKLKFRKEFEGGIQSSPVLVDLNGDRVLDILVATYQGDRKLHALSGRDGATLWSFEFRGEKDIDKLGAYHSPAVGDLDGDGVPEIVATSYDGNVYALNLKGALIWKFACQASIFHSPTLCDLNGDKKREILVVDNMGYLYALSPSGKQLWRRKESTPAFGVRGGIVVAEYGSFIISRGASAVPLPLLLFSTHSRSRKAQPASRRRLPCRHNGTGCGVAPSRQRSNHRQKSPPPDHTCWLWS